MRRLIIPPYLPSVKSFHFHSSWLISPFLTHFHLLTTTIISRQMSPVNHINFNWLMNIRYALIHRSLQTAKYFCPSPSSIISQSLIRPSVCWFHLKSLFAEAAVHLSATAVIPFPFAAGHFNFAVSQSFNFNFGSCLYIEGSCLITLLFLRYIQLLFSLTLHILVR